MKVEGREGSQIVLDGNLVWPSEADFILEIETRTKIDVKAEVLRSTRPQTLNPNPKPLLGVSIVWPSVADFILEVQTRTKIDVKAEVPRATQPTHMG